MGKAFVKGGVIVCRFILFFPPPPSPSSSPWKSFLPPLPPLLLGDNLVQAAPGQQGCFGKHLPPPPHRHTFSMADTAETEDRKFYFLYMYTVLALTQSRFCKYFPNFDTMPYLPFFLFFWAIEMKIYLCNFSSIEKVCLLPASRST